MLVSCPALGSHVCGVIGWCAEEQMRWVAARSVIASMKYPATFRDGSIGEFPGQTMCMSVPSYGVVPDGTVTPWHTPGCPLPAFVGTFDGDSRVEAFF